MDVAVEVQLLDFDIQHVGDARQARRGIEDAEQFLLLFDAQLQIRGDRVGKLCRLVHPHRGDDGLVIQRLLQLDILLKEAR